MAKESEPCAVSMLRDYLRIPTAHPNPDYSGVVEFMRKVAQKYDFLFDVQEIVPNKPIITMKWLGKDPTLKAIMLNSHTDVVPVISERWKHNPFGAEKDEKGNIYGRGAQDMKCLTIQHIEAVGTLKRHGLTPDRTIIISLVPDEEIGSADGMEKWVQSDEFKALNVGFVLDEGISSPGDKVEVFYAERVAWWLKVTAEGDTGHGSQLIPSTAVLKLWRFLSHFVMMHDSEFSRMKSQGLKLGDVTSVNINGLRAGFCSESGKWQANVIPATATAVIDMRIALDKNLKQLDSQIATWAQKAGVQVEFLAKRKMEHHITDVDSVWGKTLTKVLDDLHVKFELAVSPVGTDSRYIRALGIPAIGFSPLSNTPILLHGNDEYIPQDVFMRGIGVLEILINKLAHIPRQPFDDE